MVLERVYADQTKIKLVKTALGTTVIHESPFVHSFHLDTGEIEVVGENGETFSLTPPETIKGLTLEVQLWQDTNQDLVAFRYLYRAADTSIKADVRIGFYFSVFEDKVKIRIEGSLAQAVTLKIPLRAVNHFIHGNCLWSGEYDAEMDRVVHGVGFDWSDIKDGLGDACRWDSANRILEVDVPKSFSLDPNTVTTASGATPAYTWQKKILRTSDGTIHIILYRTGYVTHYYSYDDGANWNSIDVWNVARSCSIAKDSGDNLVAAAANSSNLFFKKAAVTKGTPWTWSWGSEKTVDSAYATFIYPDVLVDGNDYFHVVYERTDGYPRWARCTDGSGDSWTVTELSGFSSTFTAVSVVKDSSNNLFVFGARTDRNALLKAVKITYNGGTSWTVGSYYNVSSANAYPACTHVLSDDRLIVTYTLTSSYNLRFRKSTNPSDVSSWGTETTIKDGIDGSSYHSIMVISSTTIRVYYCDGLYLCYKESTDGGANWGSEQNVYTTGSNTLVNVSKSAVNSKIDYMWLNGTSPIYHDYYSAAPPPALDQILIQVI
jgi:hypothetical protein